MEERQDPIRILLDPEDNSDIVLYNEQDEPITFKQLAVFTYEEKLYAILQPIGVEGVNEDGAFAFEVTKNEEGFDTLVMVEDDALIDDLFDVYRESFS